MIKRRFAIVFVFLVQAFDTGHLFTGFGDFPGGAPLTIGVKYNTLIDINDA